MILNRKITRKLLHPEEEEIRKLLHPEKDNNQEIIQSCMKRLIRKLLEKEMIRKLLNIEYDQEISK